MKKILMLSLIALFFISCSTDDSADLLTQENSADIAYSAKGSVGNGKTGGGEQPVVSCFSGLAAFTRIDVSAGLNNPVINFTGSVPSTVSSNIAYNISVEIQGLADCEDFNLTSGLPIIFTSSGSYTNVYAVPPAISVLPNQLPVCYKWRMIFERANSLTSPCKSVSQWYDAPLF